MSRIIILPGIGGSGSEHWQTLWEAEDKSLERFSPASWDHPELGDWVAALDAAVAASPEPPVLVAHSLACLLVAHWQARSARPVTGAMLVAVPDAAGPAFPREAADFADPPAGPLRFPSVIVASNNDPYGTMAYVRMRAEQWGSQLVEVGNHGHLNAKSGLGAWPEGRAILDAFTVDLVSPTRPLPDIRRPRRYTVRLRPDPSSSFRQVKPGNDARADVPTTGSGDSWALARPGFIRKLE